MITCSDDFGQTKKWQTQLSQAITDPTILLKRLDLDESYLSAMQSASKLFPLRVPEYFCDLIEKNNIHDPLLRQILPLDAEHFINPAFNTDPTGDLNSMATSGVLHKYKRRALLITTGACAVNCRYCFRRHFPYQAENASYQHWAKALSYIQQQTSLDEIILSGGDLLSLPDRSLEILLNGLQQIPHIRRIRWHTRFPVVIPERLDDHFLALLKNSLLPQIMVLHINHPNEISPRLKKALAALKEQGVTLLNQAVLLKGVNDDVETLIELSLKLFDAHILPYYLHQLDQVQGASHFLVEQNRAKNLVKTLKNQISGYLVPRFVQEIAGQQAKFWL